MTSSATQTEAGRDASGTGRGAGGWLAAHPAAVAIVVLTLAGWGLIGHVNRWELRAPVIALGLGWLAILLAGRFLWRAAEVAARDGEAGGDDGFAGRTPRQELEADKRALLKAIKDAEFDRDMGKLSAADADAIVRVYRAKAIEVLKELEDPDGTPRGPEEQVEHELRARLALAARSKPA